MIQTSDTLKAMEADPYEAYLFGDDRCDSCECPAYRHFPYAYLAGRVNSNVLHNFDDLSERLSNELDYLGVIPYDLAHTFMEMLASLEE